MTLIELKKQVDLALMRAGSEECEVCIPNNKAGMGGTPATGVKGAYRGFDWDKGKFFIFPEKEMVERTPKIN
jgi:hypothetical protein